MLESPPPQLVTPARPRRGDGQAEPAWLAGVIVPTHNDGSNIGPLVERLLSEPGVGEVLVVASACVDATVPTVLELAAANPRVRLYVEAERSGKPSAINFGLGENELPVVMVVSGDVLPDPGTVTRLVEAVRQPGVGLAGGRPLPRNSETTAIGHAVHLMWRLHHRVAMSQPKIGEVIAMRAEAARPLPETSVDEPCFQAMLQGAGWKPVYLGDAIIANWGPSTAKDFVKQRRQVHTGNLWLKKRQGYTVPSLQPALLLTELWRDLLDDPRRCRPMRLAWTVGAVTMEVWARVLARCDFVRGRENRVWGMVESAKAPALGPHRLGTRDS
jgi:hypothetical protein